MLTNGTLLQMEPLVFPSFAVGATFAITSSFTCLSVTNKFTSKEDAASHWALKLLLSGCGTGQTFDCVMSGPLIFVIRNLNGGSKLPGMKPVVMSISWRVEALVMLKRHPLGLKQSLRDGQLGPYFC